MSKIAIINVTPHSLTFMSQDGSVYEVKPSGVVISAKPEEQVVSEANGVTFVRTQFVADAANDALLRPLEMSDGPQVIVGSIIAAQAFPGRVVAMIPAVGFERVPPEQKRMRDDRFTTF